MVSQSDTFDRVPPRAPSRYEAPARPQAPDRSALRSPVGDDAVSLPEFESVAPPRPDDADTPMKFPIPVPVPVPEPVPEPVSEPIPEPIPAPMALMAPRPPEPIPARDYSLGKPRESLPAPILAPIPARNYSFGKPREPIPAPIPALIPAPVLAPIPEPLFHAPDVAAVQVVPRHPVDEASDTPDGRVIRRPARNRAQRDISPERPKQLSMDPEPPQQDPGGAPPSFWIRLGESPEEAAKKRDFNLYGRGYGDVAAEAAKEVLMRIENRVRTVDLGGCDLTAEGGAALGAGLKLATARAVETVRVNYNPALGDDGIVAIAKGIPQSVHTLEIGECGLTPKGAAQLSTIIATSLPHLKNLHCFCNPGLGDSGAGCLIESVASGHEFDVLDLNGCGVSAVARKWFRAASINAIF